MALARPAKLRVIASPIAEKPASNNALIWVIFLESAVLGQEKRPSAVALAAKPATALPQRIATILGYLMVLIKHAAVPGTITYPRYIDNIGFNKNLKPGYPGFKFGKFLLRYTIIPAKK